MIASPRIFSFHKLKRCICTTAINSGKYAQREGRFMDKLLGGSSGKRKWYETKQRPSSAVTMEKLTSNHVSRRMTVLNKLFMQHITDLMASGEVSTELIGKSIEVSHVKVTPNFQQVRVYWFSKRENALDEIEKLLDNCAYRLRHELTQLRVIGRVPMIKFVKNKQLAAMELLEKRFKIADYGEEHQPSSPGFIEDELVITTKLPTEIKQRLLELNAAKDTEDEEPDEDAFSDLPAMRHDVLGLDHHLIMSKVTHSLNKYHKASMNRLLNVTTFTPAEPQATNFDPAAFEAAKNDSKAFENFLVKRKIEERQKIRRERRARYNDDTPTHNDTDEYFEHSKDDEDVDILEDIRVDFMRGTEHEK